MTHGEDQVQLEYPQGSGIQLDCERFNYDALDADLANEARKIVKIYRQRSENYIIETGRDLLLMKDRLKQGQFQRWVKVELNLDKRMSQHFMLAAMQFGNESEIVSLLPPTIIYKLAAPTTPEDVRASIVSRAKAGEKLSPKAILAEIREKAVRTKAAAEDVATPRPSLTTEQHAREHVLIMQEDDAPEARAYDDELERHEQHEREEARIEQGAYYVVEKFGAEPIAAFYQGYGKLLARVFAKAAELADVRRALGEPTIEVPVDAFERMGLLSQLSESKRDYRQLAAYEGSLNNGDPLPPIVVERTSGNRYILRDGVMTFWVLRDRLDFKVVPVRVIPTAAACDIAATDDTKAA